MKDAFNSLLIKVGEILTNRVVTGQITEEFYQSEMDRLIGLIKN